MSEYHKHTLSLFITAESFQDLGKLVNEMW